MIKRILKQTAILTTLLILAGHVSVVIPNTLAAGSATLSFGSATLRNGCPGSIPINLDTGGEGIWAADVGISVSGPTAVDSLAIGSVLPMQACNDASVPDLMLCGARQPGTNAYTGTGVYGTINVTPSSTGSISFDFDDTVTNVINDSIEDVLGTATGRSYTVAERFNKSVDGVGFCNPDTTAPTISVTPSNGKNNVPLDTSVKLTLSDDRVGVDVSTLTFSVNGKVIDTFSYTATGGTYTPSAPFELGEKITVEVRVCDLVSNCRNYSGSFRTIPPLPPANCGDTNVDEGEECDAGYQTATCDRDCTFVECGDGVINDVAGEQCDDFNKESGDGCSAICTLEAPVEDQTYCPVIELESVTQVYPSATETPLLGEGEVTEEGETATTTTTTTAEEGLRESDFEEAATSSIVEAELRGAAKPVALTPETAEQKEKLDPCVLKYGTEGADFDRDGDGLSDRTECYSETDPDEADTDGDTCLDGEEINRFYTDPLVADCSISDYVEEEVLIIDPKPNWTLTSLEVSGSAPRQSLSVGITAFPALQKTYSKVLTQYEGLLEVLERDVDEANTVAIQQKNADATDVITKLQETIKATQVFIEENPEGNSDLESLIERTATFLDAGSAAVMSGLEQAESLYSELDEYRTKSVFLGEVTELQTVGVGNTTTAGFNLIPKKTMKDGVYDLVATAAFADGGTKSSAPVRIYLSSSYEVDAPLPQTLDGKPVGLEKIVTENPRPVLSGKSVYGAMVFATWESLVLESSIIADSAEGIFDVQPPRDLETGEEHTVTMYAVTETDKGFVRSKSTTVDFEVAKASDLSVYYFSFSIALFLLLLSALNYVISRKARRKRG